MDSTDDYRLNVIDKVLSNGICVGCGVCAGICPSIPLKRLFMTVPGFLAAHHYYKHESSSPWDAPSTWIKFWVRPCLIKIMIG